MNSKIFRTIIIAIIAVLLLSNAVTAYVLIQKQKSLKLVEVKIEDINNEEILNNNEQSATSTISENTETVATSSEETTTSTMKDYGWIYAEGGLKVSVPAGMERVKVDWIDEEKIEAKDFFLPKYKSIASLSVASYEKIFNIPGEYGDFNAWYINKIGVISSSSDKYANQNVFRVILSCEAFDCSSNFEGGLVVADEISERLIIFPRYSGGQVELKKIIGAQIFEEDKNVFISELENPETIVIANSSYKLIKKASDFLALSPMSTKTINLGGFDYIFDSAFGKKIYLSSKGCFYAFNENGGYSYYEINYPFVISAAASVLDLTFNDGAKNKEDFINMVVGGCGAGGCGRLIKANNNYLGYEELKEVGKFGNSDIAYEFAFMPTKDGSNALWEVYNSAYFYGEEKPSTDDFIKQHPLVLWKSPIPNYYLGFLNAKFMPAVECGKPVIYLYPEETTDVKVEVKPTGGLTITEPAYNNGWLVKANPQSELYNYADGQNYPYLFWEGKGVFYEQPKEGFVVAREEVDKFLDEKLAALGLIEKEIKDFKEFWAPKMQEKPYYFVTFLPQADFNNIAPLSVSPKPDTIIRVFMDYKGLDNPISVVEPKIKTPARIGFTVVEWGGALGRE